MRRYTDSFFRHWLLIMIPLLILPVGEYLLVRHPAPQISANANIYVTQPVSDGTNPFTSPADIEISNLVQWLQSSSFDLKVAMKSSIYAQGLAHAADPATAAYNDLSKHVQVTPLGDNLVNISYDTLDGQEGLQVVRGLLDTATDTTLSITQWQQTIVGGYYSEKLRAAQLQEQQSSKALSDYAHNHGITPAMYALQMDSDPTFANLYAQSKNDQQNVTTLAEQVASSSGQPVSPITIASRQAYFVADQPTIMLTYSSKKKMLTYVGIALALGLIVGVVLLVLLTATDKTMRFAEEAQLLLQMPVMAIVTHSGALSGRDPQTATNLLPTNQIAESDLYRALMGPQKGYRRCYRVSGSLNWNRQDNYANQQHNGAIIRQP
jgi:capsular polysaccharide biosynthesis protein